MKKVRLSKSGDKLIGALRVNAELFNKVAQIAKDNNVSNQEVVHAILEASIDDIQFV